MKINTITFHRSINYGAVLQSYALQRALKKCGYESEIIDYSRFSTNLFIKINYKNVSKAIKQVVLNMLSLMHYNERKRLFKRFNDFFSSKLRFTKCYGSYQELCDEPPISDMVLIGSDQVWNITHRYRPEFFAEFAPSNVKKASYAASIGNYKYTDQQKNMLLKGLKDIYPISVRESSAKDFLNENFDIKANVHPDPVFLLNKEEWSSIAVSPSIKEKYVLCYALTRSDLMQKAMDKLKKKYGYKIVVVSSQPNKFVKGDIHIYDAGPCEFLGLFKNAECVLTTSFHGTAFSILFNKPFYNFTIDYYSSRTSDLLKKFEVTDRVPKTVDEIEIDEMDYTNANKIKEDYVKSAYDYLKSLSVEINGGNTDAK